MAETAGSPKAEIKSVHIICQNEASPMPDDQYVTAGGHGETAAVP